MTEAQCYLEKAKKNNLIGSVLHHRLGKNSLQIEDLYVKKYFDDKGNELFSVWALVKHSSMGVLEDLSLDEIERFYN
ncbi:hypothetical protein [Flavobacterium sp. AG291]|uniref:hypothetical protein n=1 Tax=Flavobacterium sp. AG291 TaxID=2184000 RepID=UPI000E0AE085|nr:hypothetical protein [Flavobacterium sp. AG291]RDI11248.1 hypothetical protein DEU42_106182 [Flavobacterium sp. AG291]